MPLATGTRLGPYEILEPIGRGGMGEVFRARDTRLGRDVAIKVSAEKFSERFEREARAIAALNHPNICTLHDVGPNYLVMELIEGPTLADRIKDGAIPLDESLHVARQIADALEAAHEKGITHRDLKPGNIKIKPDGVVKVLDFGLAKAAGAPAPASPASPEQSPTISMAATQAGVILGTAAYMSPEQARGKVVDKRADIWSFGVVLYEMLTGNRLFQGEDLTETLASVVKEEPRFDQAPAKVRRLLRKCLEKDPKRRLRDIGDAWELLEEPRESESTAPLQSRLGMSGWLGRLGWVLAAVATLALAALAFVHFREQPPVAELSRFKIPMPANVNFPGATATEEVSPDGRKLAFTGLGADGKSRLWIRSLDSLDARPLPGIELANPFFWSFDSRFLAFISTDHKLKKVDVAGGPAQTLCDAAGVLGGSWSREGVILYGASTGVVMRVSASGGTPTALTALDPARKEGGHGFPKLLPDGRHFLYFRYSLTPGNSGIYIGSIDAKPTEQSSKPLLVNEGEPAYYVPSGNSSNGHLLFYREGTVLAQPFNPDKLELSGDPVPVAEQVGSSSFIGFFSASTNGVLIYVSGGSAGNSQLTWFDRQGKNLGTVGEPGNFGAIALSKDGKQGVVSIRDSTASKANLWLYDFTRGGASTRFTSTPPWIHIPSFPRTGAASFSGQPATAPATCIKN